MSDKRRQVVIAGHTGDTATARAHLDDPDAAVRVAALGALGRAGGLTVSDLQAAFADSVSRVRVRAAELAASFPGDIGPCLAPLLGDDDATVVEAAAFASGDRVPPEPGIVEQLASIVGGHHDPLCREAAVAALGAIGDEAGLSAILAATKDKPAIRRRAVLALAPFAGAEVDAALQRALQDRDWQTRQAAEDLLG